MVLDVMDSEVTGCGLWRGNFHLMEEILGKASVMSDATTVNNSYHNHSDKALFLQMNLGWSFASLALSLHIFLLTWIFFLHVRCHSCHPTNSVVALNEIIMTTVIKNICIMPSCVQRDRSTSGCDA